MIRELLPEAKKIGMIYNIGEVNGKLQVKQVESWLQNITLKSSRKASVLLQNRNAAEQLAGDVDCIL